MRTLLTIGTLMMLVMPAWAQLRLQNVETGKIKTLKYGGVVKMTSKMDAAPGLTYGSLVLKGNLVEVEPSRIRVMPSEEVRTMIFDNGLVKVTETDYEELKGLKPIAVNVAGLEQIKYGGKKTENRQDFGAVLTMLGGLSALLAAPLVSIDYGDGSFNADTYYDWVVPSLAVTGLGVGIIIVNKSRKYQIDRPGADTSKKRWKIIAQ